MPIPATTTLACTSLPLTVRTTVVSAPRGSTAATRSPARISNAVVPVDGGDRRREVRREDPGADARLGKDERDLLPVLGERGRDLRADEAAADHRRAQPLDGAQLPVVAEGPEVDDPLASEGKPARPAAGREEEPLVAIGIPVVVHDAPGVNVQRHCPPARVEHEPRHLAEPDALEGLSGPQPLGERRSQVGPIRVVPDEAERPGRVDLADSGRCGVGGHSPSHDEVAVVGHRLLLSTGVRPVG